MKRTLLLTTLATASVLLGACTTYPVQDTYYDQPVVRVAPPPPQYEYYGSPPVAGFVWITGYWNWGGARYVWVPGRWEAPRPGYYWAPHRWERHGDHWRQQGGRWEHDQRTRQEPRPAPPAARPPAHGYPQGQIIQRNEPPAPVIHRAEPPVQGFPQGQIIQRNEPAPAIQPPPGRTPAPGYERDSRRAAQEGNEMRPEHRGEPRFERREETRIERREETRIGREVRPAPEQGGSPRAERDDRPRQKQDGNGPRRRGPAGDDEEKK